MNPHLIQQLGNLSQIEIDDIQGINKSLESILELMNQISQVNTDNVKELNFPLDILNNYYQITRIDEVKENSTDNSKNAPLMEQGFYLVPKVIE